MFEFEYSKFNFQCKDAPSEHLELQGCAPFAARLDTISAWHVNKYAYKLMCIASGYIVWQWLYVYLNNQ